MYIRRKITLFILVYIALAINLRAQSINIHANDNNGYIYSSQYVVNPFAPMPLLGLPGDSLIKYRGFLNSTLGKPQTTVFIDDNWEFITISETVYGNQYKIPFTASFDWYLKNTIVNNSKKYFIEKLPISKQNAEASRNAQRNKSVELVGVNLGNFGRASLRVNGNVTVAGKMIYQNQELVASSVNERQNARFDIDQKQHLNIEGTIGDRITVSMDQDSERDFDWENNIRVTYTGQEDEILQKVEAGNTSLSLPSTQFVTFTGNSQGLFGVKAISKLGPIDITSIAAVEQTKKAKQSYSGAGQSQTQKIKDYEYIKNQYFFIHEWFRNGVSTVVDGNAINLPSYYPLDDEGRHSRGNLKVTDFELYKLDLSNNPAADVGEAFIDPATPNENADNNKEGTFLRMERDIDYYLNVDLGYIRLKNRSQDQILACKYSLDDNSGAVVLEVGHGLSEIDSTLVLKMLKPQSPHPNHPTWDLMFKNVYYLGATNIDSTGFAVRLINNRATVESDRDIDGTFISQFGMDERNENGAKTSDEKVDVDNIVFLNFGELHIPTLLPFVPDNIIKGGNINDVLDDKLGEGKIYTSTVHTDYTGDSRFTIEADYSNLSSTINLGFMIVEGSETVTENGNVLIKNQDYTIDYFSGTVNIIKSDINPNAEIDVKYEKNELVSFDKKVILGSRAQMDIGQNAFIGVTALYYNQSVIDEKIEVGYEPTRNFIWDINGRFGKDLDNLTYYMDRLPIIKTNAVSKFSIEGELAQVFPNPNSVTNSATGDGGGLAYIDDFEGAKRSNTPSILMHGWNTSSAPINVNNGLTYRQKNRAKLYWYNPYHDWPTKEIWPNQQTSVQAGDNTVDILVLNYKTQTHHVGVDRDSVWAGIISPFHSGNYDQTQSKFFEIWLQGNEGKLTIDLGKISEDWNGDGVLNTEDKAESGFVQGNGILDRGEDLGLDGARDEYENGWGGALDSTAGLTYQNYLSSGETIIINPNVEDIEDPNGDNWYYDSNQDFTDYERANGTQGNQNATGGRYPDTEDLDNSGFIDKTNNYFTKTITLDRSKYFETETIKSDGTPTGWQLYRIPLTHFEKINNVDWSEIRYLRLVLSGVESSANISIAKIELVGNDWQELGIADIQSTTFTKQDSAFAITVINTEDNSEYIPPKGVKGEYNPIYGTRSKEQSLVLKFEDLQSNYKGAAKKTLFSLTGERAQSYLTYEKMKMYVYGKESKWITANETDVELFFQFGLGDQYYEITQPVYSGWDEELERNSIELDLDWLTKLKLNDSTNINKLNDADIFKDSADVKQYIFTDNNGKLTGKKITIKGEPALSRIQHFIVGVQNKTNEPISGQVWIDELRLSSVKKEKGTAMRVQSNLQLADIGKASVIFSRTDADFHVLQQRVGSNNTKQDFRLNTSLQMHKFLPESWGLSIPLNFTYSNSNNRPKFYPGSDIRVDQSTVPDSIMNISEAINFSTNFAKTRKSKNKWIKYTIDDITGNFSTTRTVNSNEIMKEVKNDSYSGSLAYNHAFARDNFFKPFKWLSFIPYLGEKLGDVNFYYTPSSLNAGINFTEKLIQKDSRVGGRSADEYNFGLNRSLNLVYKVMDNLEAKYSTGATSDMDEFRAKIITAIQKMNPGIVTSTNQNLSTNFNPVLATWLKPNFTYSAAYRWDKPRNSSIDGANIGTQLRFSSNLSLNLVSIIEAVYKPEQKSQQRNSNDKQPKNKRRRIDEEETKESTSEEQEFEGRNGKILEEQDEIPNRRGVQGRNAALLEEDINESKEKFSLMRGMHKIIKKINPINLTYTSNLNRTGNGVRGDVPIGYKFGWLPEHGLQHSDGVGTNTGQWNLVRNLSVRSGIAISTKASINLNYIQELGINRSGGTDLEVHSLSRDYFSYGEKLDKGLPFTSWTMRITGLEKWPLLKRFAKSASLEHAFSGKEVQSWKIEGADKVPTTNFFGLSEFSDNYIDDLVQSRVSSNYAPLIGITMSLGKGISVNIRHNLSKAANKTPTGLNLTKDESISLSSNYAHKGGFTIPLPFFENYKVQNTMNFTFNADYNMSETLATKNTTSLTPLDLNSSWKAGLRVSYSFSTRVTGAVILEYRESDSKRIGKKIDRDIGFDLNFSISG